MRDPFPAWLGKNSRHSRCISRGGRLHRKGKRNSRAAPPFRVPQMSQSILHRKGKRNSRVAPSFQVPQMSQFISEEPVFPALPRLSRRGSTPTTVAREAGLWESLVGKPRGKASRESRRSLDPRDGKRDTAATALQESARACPHSR